MITFWLMEIFIKQLADAKFVDGLAERYRKLQKDFETLLLLPHVDVGTFWVFSDLHYLYSMLYIYFY